MRRSLFLTPLLWLVAMLAWLVPLLSPRAAGHALYVVVLAVWPFLLLLAAASAAVAIAVPRHKEAVVDDRRYWRALVLLQTLIVSIVVAGSIPLLAFNIDPNASIAVGNALHPPLAVLAIAAVLTQAVLVLRNRRSSNLHR